MIHSDEATWAGLFRQAAGQSLTQPDGDFRDEQGNRPQSIEPFLGWRLARGGKADPVMTSRGLLVGGARPSTDARLWLALLDGDIDIDALLGSIARAPRTSADEGALTPRGSLRTIEVWTETEVSSLHALWWASKIRSRPEWGDLALRCAAWHLEHVQPDNATNRPWAVHVFAQLALRGDTEAALHAQTLIHNCMVGTGKADRLSALILVDAAEALTGS